MMKKILLLFLMCFISVSNVFANENIQFGEKEFNDYFDEKNYKLSQYECVNYDKEVNFNCVIFSALDTVDNKQIELFKFENNEEAYRYFMYVYDDDANKFTNVEEYNVDKKIDSNYSYFKAKLNGVRYFYMVNVDNYIIKSNIDIDNEEIMNLIYDDFGFIEMKKTNISSIGLKLFFIAILIIIFIILLGKYLKKRKLNKEIEDK